MSYISLTCVANARPAALSLCCKWEDFAVFQCKDQCVSRVDQCEAVSDQRATSAPC